MGSLSAAGSGTPYSLRQALERASARVVDLDADLKGVRRMAVALRTFSRERRRWVARFHISLPAIRARSAVATRLIRGLAPAPDCVLQYGCTFVPDQPLPLYLYCDNNIANSASEALSWVRALPSPEARRAIEFERAAFERARAIFVFSDFVGRSFTELHGIAPGKVHRVFAGPNFSSPPAPIARAAPAGPVRVLFVGRDFENKGGPLLLKAIEQLRSEGEDLEVDIVGPRELHIDQPGHRFHGFLNKDVAADRVKLEELYRGADVFCLPTMYESFGIAFVEAMYYSLPVIGTRAWAIPEIVEEGVTGLTVERGDVPGLVSALRRLVRDRTLAVEMGRRGRERAEQKFSWDAVAATMLRIMADSRAVSA